MTKNSNTVQAKLDKLQEIIAWFDSDDFSLEAAKDKYEQATTLAVAIEQTLGDLKNEITVLQQSFARD